MPKQRLIVGNWKMNGTLEETLKRLTELKHKLGESSEAEVVVAPPFTALYSAQIMLQETAIKLAGQNMHWETSGPFTGEISGLFLKDAGCDYVLIGHSERRQYFGETDEKVNQKITAAITEELIPIFCLGETEEQRKEKKTEAVLEMQIKKGLHGITMNDLKEVVIAYEPVWAIGTGRTPTADEIAEALRFLRNFVAKNYDAPTADGVRFLYGGSVNPENAAGILRVKNVDGLLVGGASLDVDKFLKIIRS
jgi:triosephosphate isomerase